MSAVRPGLWERLREASPQRATAAGAGRTGRWRTPAHDTSDDTPKTVTALA